MVSPVMKSVLSLILVVFLSATNAAAQTNQKVTTEQLEGYAKRVEAALKEQKIPSATVGFIKDDFVWVRAFGFSDLENEVPTREDSAYRYASVQKSMTAVAVLQLVEKGLIDLDAEVQRYVPSYPRKKYPITIRQLLGHLSGIPHYVNRDVEQHFKDHKDTMQAIAVFAKFELVAEPGTKFIYSSYGYNLLGAAIESASGESYSRYMEEHVWKPAGMTSTRMDDPLELIPHRVRGYQLKDGALKNSEFIDVSSRFAAGGTRGTVPDLLKFMDALNHGKLLSPQSLRLMYTPMHTRDGKVSGFPNTAGYGMGWNVMHRKVGDVYTNDGGQQETRTFILNLPEKHFVMALAINLEADVYDEILFPLFELVMHEKLLEPDPKKH
jgi:CubicO group peptidase (beta-lactamase class C family)